MLDKSVPYFELYMVREEGTPLKEYGLPEGYSFSYFKSGDEKEWAKIEASVIEFSSEASASEFFAETFLTFFPELERRCIFIENEKGEKIATTMAWWEYVGVHRRPWIHWVAVKPEYQGMGLGKAVVAEATRIMTDIEGEADFYLHTQTWSHTAIRVYLDAGYMITDEPSLYKDKISDYQKGIDLLKSMDIL